MRQILLFFSILTYYTVLGQTFEQGFFETDGQFTERVVRDFKPELKNGTVEIYSYNSTSYDERRVSGKFKETISSIEEFSFYVELLNFEVDGDLEYKDSDVAFEVRVVDVGRNVIVAQEETEYNLADWERSRSHDRTGYYDSPKILFSFIPDWSILTSVIFEIRFKGRLVYESQSTWSLSNALGTEYTKFYLKP